MMQAIQAIALPLSFVVLGKVVSPQTRSKKAFEVWKGKVLDAAVSAVNGRHPIGGHCKITMTYYYLSGNQSAPDSDNVGIGYDMAMQKPVQDRLNKVVYADDFQVVETTCKRRDLNKPFVIKGLSPELAEGFISGEEFLHITIDHAPDQTLL